MAMDNSAVRPHSSQPSPRNAVTGKGERARERLVAEATRIFSAKGYTAASTREICEAAQANLASIHYYFGDKEGLYRAVLTRPIDMMVEQFGRFDDPTLTFGQAMRKFLGAFLVHYMSEAEEAMVMRLHMREMLEPSSVFRDIVEGTILPHHNALVELLARHCALKKPDTELHQLAFALVAMAHDYCMSREFIKILAPDVLRRPRAAEKILDRLVGYSEALLAHEIAARRSVRHRSKNGTGK
jgi:TetR/AcrR family transcriptional regulator, regulator of cefoperazone and chloramphenicol sensitivity